ncbi:snakin-2 [Quercus suber]|uniref:Snakin-2 n=1 Tax=Quercus suber TaxID=58331 RepID=A0AAW0IIC2_QUESU
MAIPKALIASFLISILVIHLVEADPTVNADATTGSPNCGAACSARCQLSSRPNLCKRACGTCCARCSCVPPGTSGNRDVCPCYATMIIRGGQLKCP